MFDTLAQPAFAGAIAAAAVIALEADPSYKTTEEIIRYAGVVAASNFLGVNAGKMLIPTVNQVQLARMQRMVMVGGSTAVLNVFGQRFVNQDFRMENNAIVGGVAGAGASFAAQSLFGK